MNMPIIFIKAKWLKGQLIDHRFYLQLNVNREGGRLREREGERETGTGRQIENTKRE